MMLMTGGKQLSGRVASIMCILALSILPIQRIQSLEIPLVSGWELADGSVILNEDQLWEAGIECDMLFCFFPMGTSSSCDNGRLVAASGNWFWRYQDEPGVQPIAYDPVNDLIIR